jgi:hypothetical protein
VPGWSGERGAGVATTGSEAATDTGTGRDACTETDNVAGGIAMGTEALEVVSTLFGGEGGAVAGMAVGACGDVSALVSESEMANFAASSACARIYVSQVS